MMETDPSLTLLAQAVFHCRVCGSLAANFTLWADNTLKQTGFIGESTEYLADTDLPALRAALEAEDVRAIYTQDTLRAPFYCPECDAVYCGQHWKVQAQFDSDFPGWYDCSYGTCPEGHRRVVDD